MHVWPWPISPWSRSLANLTLFSESFGYEISRFQKDDIQRNKKRWWVSDTFAAICKDRYREIVIKINNNRYFQNLAKEVFLLNSNI